MPTNFQILKVQAQKSRYTQKDVFAVFFKGDDGKSYKTWLDPANGNFRRWEPLMKEDMIITGLKIKSGRLIDADSYPRAVVQQ